MIDRVLFYGLSSNGEFVSIGEFENMSCEAVMDFNANLDMSVYSVLVTDFPRLRKKWVYLPQAHVTKYFSGKDYSAYVLGGVNG